MTSGAVVKRIREDEELIRNVLEGSVLRWSLLAGMLAILLTISVCYLALQR